VLEEHLLDRHRVDVVAAADDQVLGPAGDPQVAVVVEPAEVAGVDPARLDEGAAVVRLAQVAGEHAGPAIAMTPISPARSRRGSALRRRP
jgi:hypothetical protein